MKTREICQCGHEKLEHNHYGSRTLGISKTFYECNICSCKRCYIALKEARA
jgi:hypothetical protein